MVVAIVVLAIVIIAGLGVNGFFSARSSGGGTPPPPPPAIKFNMTALTVSIVGNGSSGVCVQGAGGNYCVPDSTDLCAAHLAACGSGLPVGFSGTTLPIEFILTGWATGSCNQSPLYEVTSVVASVGAFQLGSVTAYPAGESNGVGLPVPIPYCAYEHVYQYYVGLVIGYSVVNSPPYSQPLALTVTVVAVPA